MGIIAAESGQTSVRITFPTGVSVLYSGLTYSSGNDLVVTLDQYEVLHLEDDTDLTGVRVTANKKVAVFAGRR